MSIYSQTIDSYYRLILQNIYFWIDNAFRGVKGFKASWGELAATLKMTPVALTWVTGAIAAITVLVGLYDWLTTSAKEANEAISDFKNAESELKASEDKLAEINKQLTDIKSKSELFQVFFKKIKKF